jgi:hypothetical protein
MTEDADGPADSSYEPTIQQAGSTNRYVISVNASEFADSLHGSLKECFAEADRMNTNALSEFSKAREGVKMWGSAPKGLMETEDADFDATYRWGFQSEYRQNGGSGDVYVTQAPTVPERGAENKPWVSDIVIEKHGGPLDSSDEQALKRTVETFLELPPDEEHDNFDYTWENKEGNSRVVLEYTGDV